jgi:hypothetical protein
MSIRPPSHHVQARVHESRKVVSRKPLWALVAGFGLLLVPRESQAHIKWFCAYDTTIPPLPIDKVLTSTFAAIAAGFSVIMFIAYLVDRLVAGHEYAKRIDDAMARGEPFISTMVRAAVGALFVSLWTSGGLILTPELKTSSVYIPWLQLAIAGSMLFRPTVTLGAAGILGLYAYAILDYGAFHLMDYPVFPGVAIYLFLSSGKGRPLRTLGLPVLYSSVAITMMWGAIEKFGYPYWTFPLLVTHRNLTLGLNLDWFMNIAGFVEFSLAFFMLTGTALLRLACLALLALLVAAVPEFGKVDAVGHLLIITGLIAMVIAGHRTIQLPAVISQAGVVTRAGLMTAGYAATATCFFALYYGAQYLAGR